MGIPVVVSQSTQPQLPAIPEQVSAPEATPPDVKSLVRASVVSVSSLQTFNKNTIIIPDDTKFYGFQRVSLDDLNDLPRSKAVNYLIKSNDSLKFAVDTWVDYCVPDFAIQADDERDYEIIENFINDFPKGRAGFLNYLRQLAYGYYVEGGIASEEVTDAQGMPTKWTYVSPWTMAAELTDHPELGEYYIYGQRQHGSYDMIVLEDEANPTGKFIYLPAHQNGDDPFGSSSVVPALFAISGEQDLITDIVNFTKGRVFPKHIYSIDVNALADAGYSVEQIAEAQDLASKLLDETLEGADITQDIVISVPIVATLVGAMERANIDGGEMILDILERKEQRGLKIPRVIYGSRRSGTSLNDNETRIEWYSFFKRLNSGMSSIEAAVRFHCDSLLMMNGSTGTGGILIDRSDPEISRYNAELFKMEIEGFVQLASIKGKNPNGVDVPLFTAAELRRKVIESQPSLNDLEIDLPPELMDMEMPAMLPMQPMGNDPEGNDNGDTELLERVKANGMSLAQVAQSQVAQMYQEIAKQEAEKPNDNET